METLPLIKKEQEKKQSCCCTAQDVTVQSFPGEKYSIHFRMTSRYMHLIFWGYGHSDKADDLVGNKFFVTHIACVKCVVEHYGLSGFVLHCCWQWY